MEISLPRSRRERYRIWIGKFREWEIRISRVMDRTIKDMLINCSAFPLYFEVMTISIRYIVFLILKNISVNWIFIFTRAEHNDFPLYRIETISISSMIDN